MTEMDDSHPTDPVPKKCMPSEFVEAHWKAYLNETGRLVEDTYKINGKDTPPEIRIGSFNVVRCLDLALPQMALGQKFRINCPERFAYGGATPFDLE